MIEQIYGDLLSSDMQVIAHGCNCFHTMSAGIAKEIKIKYPQAFAADKATIYGDINKLGTYSRATITEIPLDIINCYTQHKFGTDKVHVDYDAIIKVMTKIKNDYSPAIRIGFPRIGCGLAGGDWDIVYSILDRVFDDRFVWIYMKEKTK